ncbi:MAG: hypothetical protein GY934_04655, partial [Gammaproteobacteria bacterium]|nr:hypothetical protein [Gammaproteobacteria bacterium]
CPDLTKAVQVADCPAEEELKHMFSSTCGDAETNSKDPKVSGMCKSFEAFKQRKNTALWESVDGEYMGYVTCNVPAAEIKTGKLLKMSLTHKGVMDKLICTYEGGTELSLRTRQSCKIPGAKLNLEFMILNCPDGGKTCKAVCD